MVLTSPHNTANNSMKWILLVVASSLLTTVTGQCVDSTLEINRRIFDTFSPNQNPIDNIFSSINDETLNIELCEDTVYEIGGDGTQPPIIISQSNVRLSCGENGMGKGCVLSGGDSQIIVMNVRQFRASKQADVSFVDSSLLEILQGHTNLENVEIMGLTFESAKVNNVYVSTQSNVTIKGCTFTTNTLKSNIWTEVAPSPTNSPSSSPSKVSSETPTLTIMPSLAPSSNPSSQPSLSSHPSSQPSLYPSSRPSPPPQSSERALISNAENEFVRLMVENCTFSENKINSLLIQLPNVRTEHFMGGIITMNGNGNILTVERSYFSGNDMSTLNPSQSPDFFEEYTYMIFNLNGKVTLSGNCFKRNTFNIATVMVSSTNDGKDIDSNFGSFNVGRTDPRRTCIGVGIYDTLPMMVNETLSRDTCNEFEKTFCSIVNPDFDPSMWGRRSGNFTSSGASTGSSMVYVIAALAGQVLFG
mmetsp:Transcript_18590/g.23599  ORF Transcript_18590/g.23599 Transcript_18590/m.23599 type:complete len:474 (+) Transcript_18590:83-1504(+)